MPLSAFISAPPGLVPDQDREGEGEDRAGREDGASCGRRWRAQRSGGRPPGGSGYQGGEAGKSNDPAHDFNFNRRSPPARCGRRRQRREASARPPLSSQNGPALSRRDADVVTWTRRGFLRAGVSATVWTAGSPVFVNADTPARNGARILTAGPAGAAFGAAAGTPSPFLGFDGATPGPLLRLRVGEPFKARLVNHLEAPTTLHWHGLRIVNAMAGVGGLTQTAAAPGGSFDYAFTPPDPGFAWYRPHAGDGTADQVARGLYGPIIVDEAKPPEVDLELAVALRDFAIKAGGEFDPAAGVGGARIGSSIAANDRAAPLTASAKRGARIRLRLVNAAISRIMIIAIEGARPTIAAIDSQPSEAFEPLRNAFPMGPGARFDLVFDMPREADAKVRFVLRGGEQGATPDEKDQPLLVFATTAEEAAKRPPFVGLGANPKLPAEIDLERAKRVDLTIAGGDGAPPKFNDAALDAPWPPKPLFSVPKGSPVTLGFVNKTQSVQAIRFAGHVGRQLHALDDGWEPYWRDNVLVAAGKMVHVAFVADNPGRWPIESADLDRQVAGLRTYFEVA
jgi:FtsP/CotA-like multicopper oxidase with cupredoxin domain